MYQSCNSPLGIVGTGVLTHVQCPSETIGMTNRIVSSLLFVTVTLNSSQLPPRASEVDPVVLMTLAVSGCAETGHLPPYTHRLPLRLLRKLRSPLESSIEESTPNQSISTTSPRWTKYSWL